MRPGVHFFSHFHCVGALNFSLLLGTKGAQKLEKKVQLFLFAINGYQTKTNSSVFTRGITSHQSYNRLNRKAISLTLQGN